jgi:hypothetical protein
MLRIQKKKAFFEIRRQRNGNLFSMPAVGPVFYADLEMEQISLLMTY